MPHMTYTYKGRFINKLQKNVIISIFKTQKNI